MVTESFIPVAENVSELQTSDDDKGRFFRDVAVQGRMKGRSRPGVSHQGIYAFTADGITLSSGNPLEADKTLALLREAMASWERNEPNRDSMDVMDPEASDPQGYPEDGTVLRLTVRDLPRGSGVTLAAGEERFARTWNNDFVWLSKRDTRSLLPALLEIGAIRDVPRELLDRLARFHLRDIVRGEPLAWGKESVRNASLVAEVVKRDGATVALRYGGHAVLGEHVAFQDAHKPIDWSFDNALEVAIAGEATWDDEAGAFMQLDLLAAGQRSGAHRYNVRTRDPGPAPIGFSFELAGDTDWERTPPHVIRITRKAGEPDRPPATTVSGEPYFGTE